MSPGFQPVRQTPRVPLTLLGRLLGRLLEGLLGRLLGRLAARPALPRKIVDIREWSASGSWLQLSFMPSGS